MFGHRTARIKPGSVQKWKSTKAGCPRHVLESFTAVSPMKTDRIWQPRLVKGCLCYCEMWCNPLRRVEIYPGPCGPQSRLPRNHKKCYFIDNSRSLANCSPFLEQRITSLCCHWLRGRGHLSRSQTYICFQIAFCFQNLDAIKRAVIPLMKFVVRFYIHLGGAKKLFRTCTIID